MSDGGVTVRVIGGRTWSRIIYHRWYTMGKVKNQIVSLTRVLERAKQRTVELRREEKEKRVWFIYIYILGG